MTNHSQTLLKLETDVSSLHHYFRNIGDEIRVLVGIEFMGTAALRRVALKHSMPIQGLLPLAPTQVRIGINIESLSGS